MDLDGGWGDHLRAGDRALAGRAAGSRGGVRGPGLRHAGRRTRHSARPRPRACVTGSPPAPAGSRCGSCSGCGPGTRTDGSSRSTTRGSTRCGRPPGSSACRSTIHVADPIAFFEPLDARNERWEELHEHPDWHFWPTRPAGRPDLDGFPPFDELIDALEARRRAPPGDGVHRRARGCAAEDLARVSTILERAPNFHVDIGGPHRRAGPPAVHDAGVHRALGRPGRVRHRHGARSRLVRRVLPVPRDARRVVPLRRRSRRAAEPGPVADPRPRACPTTCCARCTGRTRCASSGSEPAPTDF